ncbi:MAG: glycosyltransferase, partial [Deltaproteobacteria bacterium]
MRLGLVTGEFPPMPGGIGDYTAELARSLAARGSEVHVIAPTSAAGAPATGWTVHPVVRTWSLGALLRIRRLTRRLGLQALLVEYQAGAYRPSAPIHFLPTVAGVPTFTTFHDLLAPHLFPLAGRLRRDAITFLARSSTGVIVADPADEDELHRRGIADVARIPIGSNIRCAPPADFDRDALRARYGVAPADALVGHFGFLH